MAIIGPTELDVFSGTNNDTVDEIADPDAQLRKVSGQSSTSTTTGSGILSSGGDPLSGSMSVNPQTNSPDIESATRLLQDTAKTGDTKQITKNVKTVLGGESSTPEQTVTHVANSMGKNAENTVERLLPDISGSDIPTLAVVGAGLAAVYALVT